MRLRAPEFVVDEKDPFKNDSVNRKESIEYLTNILQNIDESLVISIDGKYGKGKTVFLKIWKKWLELKGFPTICFNAWDSDYCENAMVAILGELNENIDEIIKNKEESSTVKSKFKDLIQSGTEITYNMLPLLAKLGITRFTGLSREELEELQKAFMNSDTSLIGAEINQYANLKESIAKFRYDLSEIANQLSNEKKGKTLPLVIFIDELDRCKPTFAIEVLEIIKHFFYVPNVIFVLGVNKSQLNQSIKTIYGGELDAEGYLRRFIDLDYMLPNPEFKDFVEDCFIKFELEEKFKERQEYTQNNEDLGILKIILSSFFSSMMLDLRTLEKSVAQICIALLTTPKTEPIFPLLFGTLLCVKAKDAQLYEDFITKRDTAEIIKFLDPYLPRLPEHSQDILKFIITVSTMHYSDAEPYYSTILKIYNDTATSSDITKEYANNIIEYFSTSNLDVNIMFGCLDKVISKIEISSEFSIL